MHTVTTLVVDDDPIAAEIVAAVLEDLGHTVLLAENALEALEQLQQRPDIALILSDMHMPMVSGIELLGTLREQGQQQPFILLTGDDPQAFLAQEPRLNACLTKDFTLEESLPPVVAQALVGSTLHLGE